MRRLNPAQIIKIVALPGHDESVGLRHALQDGHGISADFVEDLRPASLKFLRRKVSLIPRIRLPECERPQHQNGKSYPKSPHACSLGHSLDSGRVCVKPLSITSSSE